jgi:hypothetical protein
VRVELPDPVCAWTGIGTIHFDDADGATRDWQGVGGLGAVEPIGESTDGSATGVKCSLFEVPSQFQFADGTWIGDYLERQAVRGVLFEIYVGTLNETYQQVEASVLIWKGRLDQFRITDAGTTLTIDITGESRAIDQRRPAIKRFTDEWQQRKYPGDRFFEYVPQMTEVQILWAKAEQSSTMPVSSGTIGGGGVDRAGGAIRDF